MSVNAKETSIFVKNNVSRHKNSTLICKLQLIRLLELYINYIYKVNHSIIPTFLFYIYSVSKLFNPLHIKK